MRLIDLYYLAVIGLVCVTPRAMQGLVARSLAQAAYAFSQGKRGRMERNIEIAFGKISDRERREIVVGALRGGWEELFGWSLRRMDWGGVTVQGLDELEASLARGRGVILWESNGFGRRILAKRVLHARGVQLHQIHGPHALGGLEADATQASRVQTHWVRPWFDGREREFVSELIYLPRDDSLGFTRTLAARLRENAVLCVTGDGREGQKLVTLPFLGQRVKFAPGMVSMARLTGAAIHPLLGVREKNGRVCVRIASALDLKGDVTAQYAAWLEREIWQHPEMYRNWHLMDDDTARSTRT